MFLVLGFLDRFLVLLQPLRPYNLLFRVHFQGSLEIEARFLVLNILCFMNNKSLNSKIPTECFISLIDMINLI